jgi:NDP-sugar pyrophosphorylase family protein
MATNLRFSANINTFNACADRYVLSGYGERLSSEELIQAATQVEALTGVEVVGFWHDLRHPRHLGLRQVGLGLLFVQRPTDPS